MDLSNSNLVKDLECPICLDIFNEPKLLSSGHTICQKCVNIVVATHRTAANAGQGHDGNSIKCPECGVDTLIPPSGLKTNYRLVDLVCRAQKSLVDVCACNGCGKKAPLAEMYTCDTCQETLNTECASKQHRDHALSVCNKATRQQIEEACQGIASSGGLAETYIGLSMSHLNRALKETELISEASAFASEARKGFESVLHDCREKLEDLFPDEEDEEPTEAEDSGTSCNSFDLSEFGDAQEVTELKVLDRHWNPHTSINDNIAHTTLTELYVYGNKITELRGLDALVNLDTLNVSYNRLRKIQGLTSLVKLQYVYLEHNFIEKIKGLDTLVNLELLDLSENRIKAIENLDSQRNSTRSTSAGTGFAGSRISRTSQSSASSTFRETA
ncbi:Leucine Rich Repeat family protein [Aphelenchoides avenae]|nr:Leucine Rich Repeat family protein [Aphelenchus avenae]